MSGPSLTYAVILRQVDMVIAAGQADGLDADACAAMIMRAAAIRLRYLVGPEAAAERCYRLGDELATLEIFPKEKP